MIMSAFLALVRKDLILYFSNRRALIITLAAPIAIAAFFGSLFGGGERKPSKVPVAVVDLDRSALSRDLAGNLAKDATLDVAEMPEAEAIAAVRAGKRRAAIVLPAKFGDQAGRALFGPGKKPEIALHVDPSQGMVLPMVRGLLAQHAMKTVTQSMFNAEGTEFRRMREEVAASPGMAADEKRDLVAMFDSIDKVQKRAPSQGKGNGKAGGGNAPVFDLPFVATTHEVTSGADRKYNGYSHSFAGMSVQFLLFMGIDIGIGLLLARRLGMWKRLRAAPLTRATLLGSTVASTTLIAILLMLAIFAAGMAIFGVRIEGSLVGFLGVVVAFGVLTASFGLLLAAIGNNPEATRGLAILATLLLVMLGGAWVPSFVFPEWLQTLSQAAPTRWAVDGLAAMTWRGLGVEAAIQPILSMLAFSAVTLGFAIWRFRWEE